MDDAGREGLDVYHDMLNMPAFLAMPSPISGLNGSDAGCGEGSNTRKLAQIGANRKAIDIAPRFIRHASATEATEPLGIENEIGDGMTLPFADASFFDARPSALNRVSSRTRRNCPKSV